MHLIRVVPLLLSLAALPALAQEADKAAAPQAGAAPAPADAPTTSEPGASTPPSSEKPAGKKCEGESCPHKASGESCPMKAQGKSCPHKASGKSCPMKAQGKSCPHKASGKSCPMKAQGKSCPHKKGGHHGHRGKGHHGHHGMGHHGTSAYHALRMGCPEGKPCFTGGGFAVWPKLRLITGAEYIHNRPLPVVGAEPDVLFIGENDGFFLDHLRVGFGGTWKRRLDFRLVLDAATPMPGGGANEPVRTLLATARDAYLVWRPMQLLNVWVGQLIMPQNEEGETSRAELHFSSRSVLSDGVRAGRGYATAGMNPGRELGLVVGTQGADLGMLKLHYRFALANGNGRDESANDNKLPAAYFRMGAGFGDLVKASVGGAYNPRTVGEVPNLFKETDSSLFVDAKMNVMGIELAGIAMARSTSFDTVFPEADLGRVDLAYGVTGWVALNKPLGLSLFGFTPAYRTSYYEPRSAIEGDALWEHTFALRYDPPTGMPMHMILDATLLFELPVGGVGSVANNRVTAIFVFDL